MGLSINSYHYSYGMLQEIRRWALKVEKNKNQKLMCSDFTGYSILSSKSCNKCIYCLLDDAKNIQEEKKITKFYELINHCDCSGGYVHNPAVRSDELGDLGELKLEMIELNKHKRPFNIENSFDALYSDVMEEKTLLNFG